MSSEDDVPICKLRPVMLVIEGRLECDKCAALAVIMAMDVAEDREDGSKRFDYSAYCQDCWHEQVVEQKALDEA